MKKKLKVLVSIFLLTGFLAACADEEEPTETEQPVAPDVPGEQLPEDEGEMAPGTEPGGTEVEPGTDSGDTGVEPGSDAGNSELNPESDTGDSDAQPGSAEDGTGTDGTDTGQ